ncbi:MAG: hypothetical protein MUF81_15195 [Verrucomicrobia bacterium]|jgi:hypothetical protein|nr:hypothetical protein [Verrucomicrobiota bacterium]
MNTAQKQFSLNCGASKANSYQIGSFGLEHLWFALSVPDELSEEIRVRENQKLRDSYAKAQEEITFTLRAGLASLVTHAI